MVNNFKNITNLDINIFMKACPKAIIFDPLKALLMQPILNTFRQFISIFFVMQSKDMQRLRDENAELRLECQCLCMEVDFYLKGKGMLS